MRISDSIATGYQRLRQLVTEQEYVPRRPLQAATRQRFIVFYVYKTRETRACRRIFQSDINTNSTHSTQNDRAPTGSMHTLNSRYVTRQRPFRDNLVRLQGTSFHSERPTFNRRLPRAHPTGRREPIILPRSITTTYWEKEHHTRAIHFYKGRYIMQSFVHQFKELTRNKYA